MKRIFFVPLMGMLLFLTGAHSSSAADIQPLVGRAAFVDVAPNVNRRGVHVRPRAVVHRSRLVNVRRTIGMPCVLPPYAIVQLNWNGPQCRWADNITPSVRRYRISVR
jgi:hypothetical protein